MTENDFHWCPTCRRRRRIIDSFEDSIPERFTEDAVWVTVMDCGHDTWRYTGQAHRYPTDPKQIVQ